MGYCMHQERAEFGIAKDKHKQALKALKALMKRTDLMRGSTGGQKQFMWVETDDVLRASSLAAAMEALRWPVEHDAEGNITAICFSGQKLGDDRHFFAAIAEFVDDGSFIEMHAEDGAMWRWVFSGGKLADQHASVSWQ